MDNAVTFITYLNTFMLIFFTVLYSYKIIYILVAIRAKRRHRPEAVSVSHFNKYAVIIAARNEALVIGQLIESIKNQKYPAENIDIFVIADNCTDNTAEVAEKAGAIVRERFNDKKVGKGYALDHMLGIIEDEYSDRQYDGFFIFDADNLLEENYVAKMNDTFNRDYRIVTSYRNSKNFDTNWISSGYSIWFLHEAEYVNRPRMQLNNSGAISGTGFLVGADVFRENGGWVHHLLTEDIEFTVSQVLRGEKIGYSDAMFYDEQPVTFNQSWRQRMRWAKGIFSGKGNSFSCFDMAMTIMPALLLTFFSVAINGFFFLAGLLIWDLDGNKAIILATSTAFLGTISWIYLMLFIIGAITMMSERSKVHCAGWKKVAYTFTFPLFMLTYIPIALTALFKDVEWQPIAHTEAKSIEEMQ
ncbi:glycosyltransferase family 2 protein [Salinicoccus halitifaciens]|uniref:Cellulose synthase/poly-beta-1,6-N-acetylglucosamine synthase-like glycosyltransferase n=1 Tax=Salinicoccus halitifaciens TaxID=1073415 RepID=A0ABV2E5W1_9STAP|nr:glycosyltransferase family 2 protein [Salinicoccus halitifaciens]MCD2137116.1 glycosyltransferase family 2 protein [Salinicoccus halitifaciens]